MPAREFYVLIERDEDGGYIAHVPELRGCHTQGDTLDELMANVREAIAVCLQDDDAEQSSIIDVRRISVAA